MGKPTGSVLEETIVVSATISISVEKLHHQIRLRILSCSRMREMRREPEVPEERSPSGRMSRWPCKDCLKGTCKNSFCEKWHPPVLVLQDQEWLSVWGKAHTHIVRLSRLKGPKRMMTKVQ